MSDITNIVKGAGASLEREAFTRFGAAVNDVAGGALRDVFHLPSATSQPEPAAGEPGVWHPTRYAAALVKPDQVDFNPKLKFLFKVSFKFTPEMLQVASALGYDTRKLQENITYTITRVDRPKWDFEYEEVNMYNYKTKVLKNIKHREVGFTMYDDVGNNVLSFINLYRKLISPIARNTASSENQSPEDFGMEWDGSYAQPDTAMRGYLPGNAINVLDKMIIHQIYVERGSHADVNNWTKVVDFEFIRPRFTSIDIDDLDHENGSNFSLVNFTVDFDTLYMTEPDQFAGDARGNSLPSGDITAGQGVAGKGKGNGLTGNIFADIIINQTARAVQTGIGNIIYKGLGTSAGGRLIAGQLTGVSGVLGDATRRTLGGLATGGQGFAQSAMNFVKDNSVTPSKSQSLSSQTSSSDLNDFYG